MYRLLVDLVGSRLHLLTEEKETLLSFIIFCSNGCKCPLTPEGSVGSLSEKRVPWPPSFVKDTVFCCCCCCLEGFSFPFFFTVPASSGRHMGTDALWKHVRAKQKPPYSRLVFLFFFSLLPPEKNTSNWWETRPETSFSTHTWRLYLWLHSPKCVVLLFKNLNSTTTRVEKTFKRCSNLPLCFDAVSLTMLSFL